MNSHFCGENSATQPRKALPAPSNLSILAVVPLKSLCQSQFPTVQQHIVKSEVKNRKISDIRMSAFCEDKSRWHKYFHGTSSSTSSVEDSLPLTILEWYENKGSSSVSPQHFGLASAKALIERGHAADCHLRIVFAPLYVSDIDQLEGLRRLFLHYSVPSAVILERLNSVTHSFGTTTISTEDGDVVNLAWFYHLCKDVSILMGNTSQVSQTPANSFIPLY